VNVALVYFKDDGVQRIFRMKGDRCVIGRKNTCDLQVPVPTVSREHCELTIKDGGLLVARDLGSSNGTYRNSDRIEGEEELAPGDRLSVGPVTFTLQIDGVPEHIEPPLLDAPSASDTGSSMQSGAGLGDSDSGSLPAAQGDPDDSDADISDLISKASKAVNDDSSVFDFDIDLDDDEKSR